jgi:hypothetical protein
MRRSMAVGAKVEEAGYVFGKESMSGLQHGG